MTLYTAHLTIISLLMLELVQEFLKYAVCILNIFSIGESVSLIYIIFHDLVYTFSC